MNHQQFERLREPLRAEVEGLGYELIDVEWIREHGEHYLRLYLYHESGITVDDCEAVSNHLSPKLDEWDPIDENYYLEVCSPDLNRPLKTDRDLERNIGETVAIQLFQKKDGVKKWEGELIGFDDESVSIRIAGVERYILKKEIAQIKIVIRM